MKRPTGPVVRPGRTRVEEITGTLGADVEVRVDAAGTVTLAAPGLTLNLGDPVGLYEQLELATQAAGLLDGGLS